MVKSDESVRAIKVERVLGQAKLVFAEWRLFGVQVDEQGFQLEEHRDKCGSTNCRRIGFVWLGYCLVTAGRSESSAEEAYKLAREKNLDTIIFALADYHGIARGKLVPARNFIDNKDANVVLSSFMLMMDAAGVPAAPPANAEAGQWWPSWDEGYTDIRLIPDYSTFRIVPWAEQTGIVICDLARAECGEPLNFMPRAVVTNLEDRIASLGFSTRFTAELEWFLFDETEKSAFNKGYREMSPFAVTAQAYSLSRSGRDAEKIQVFRREIEKFGIPVDVWSAEAAPGQQEFNVPPENATKSADTAFLLKYALREIAARQDLFITFMSKLSMSGFGSGLHVNHSLWQGGQPAFFDANAVDKRSVVMRRAVAGQLATLRDFTLMFAPTVNSYKRFKPHFSSGYVLGWAHDSKSVALRTVVDSPDTCRIEHRTAGADANPYLCIAACAAGIAYGLEHELDPPDPIVGDGYADASQDTIPTNMKEAIDAFEKSEIAREYFGADFVRFYTHSRRVESEAYESAVAGGSDDEISEWELARYADVV